MNKENLTFEQLPQAISILTKEIVELKRILNEAVNNQVSKQPEQLLTIEQAAELLNLSKHTLYSKVSRNELPVMKRGKRLYFSQSELIGYIKEGKKGYEVALEYDETPIYAIFGTRISNSLKSAGIKTDKDLIEFIQEYGVDQLLKIRNMGKLAFDNIVAYLNSNDIKYKP